MDFLTLAFPAFSLLLLEEGNNDWVLGFWLGSSHHIIQGKPTLSESSPIAKNAWADLISQARRQTRVQNSTKIYFYRG